MRNKNVHLKRKVHYREPQRTSILRMGWKCKKKCAIIFIYRVLVYQNLCDRGTSLLYFVAPPPQWGAADAEIRVPSGENTELKRSPSKAWSRSVYSHTCYAYCQGFHPCLFVPYQSIHLHFFQNLSQFFPVLAVANTGSCVDLHGINRSPCLMQVSMLSVHGM